MDIFLKELVEFYFNNTVNLRPLTVLHTLCEVIYPQNGERIVTKDSVTSFRPVYTSSYYLSRSAAARSVRVNGPLSKDTKLTG